jgi:CRISPR-associated endonuclease Cas2
MPEDLIDKIFNAFGRFMEFNQEAYFHPYRALNKYLSGEYDNDYKSRAVYVNIHRLKKKGLLKSKMINSENLYKFTELGVRELERRRILRNASLKKKKWNGKWHILFFDIPEINKKLRDLFRKWLYQLGYRKFQISVWISPYDVFEETKTVLKLFNLEKYVIFITAEKIDNEKKLKEEFGLAKNEYYNMSRPR